MKTITTSKQIYFGFILFSFLFISSEVLAQNSFSYHSDNGKHKISVKNSRNDFQIQYEGDITLTDDDKDIKSVSRGGYIEIKKSSFGRKRKIIIENDGGTIVRKYYVGWSEKDYYPEGKEWLSDILPEILKSTTIAAKSRVDRFYKKGGVSEVLSEIKKMDSDHVQSAYFELLLDKDLSPKDVVKTLQTLSTTVKSDHYLSTILRRNQELFLKTPETLDAYISAAKSIESDHYVSQVIKKVVSNKSITDKQLANLLNISENLDSDHYLSEVLKSVMDNRDLNKQNMEQIMMLSKNIKSDHYKTGILKKALRNDNISKEAYDSFLTSLSDIRSDHYSSEVIKELMKNKLDTENLTTVLGIIKTNIGSDHYASSIYKKMANRNDLSEDQLIIILNATEKISSSHYLSETLLAFAPIVKKSSTKVKDTYIKVAKTINSETSFGRALKAIY